MAEHPKFLGRERAQNVEGDHACRYAVPPQPVDGFHGGVVGGAEHEKQNLGVLVPVGAAEGKFPAGEGSIFRKQLRQLVSRGFHGEVELVTVIDDVRLVHIGTDRNRMREV